MRCPKDKELILFHYNDLNDERSSQIRSHCKECLGCKERLKEFNALFSKIPVEGVQLESGELTNMLQAARATGDVASPLAIRLKDKLRYCIGGIWPTFFYRPQLAFVTAALLIGVIFIPIQRKQAAYEQDMVDMQLQMLYGEDDIDIFLDFYSLEGEH